MSEVSKKTKGEGLAHTLRDGRGTSLHFIYATSVHHTCGYKCETANAYQVCVVRSHRENTMAAIGSKSRFDWQPGRFLVSELKYYGLELSVHSVQRGCQLTLREAYHARPDH